MKILMKDATTVRSGRAGQLAGLIILVMAASLSCGGHAVPELVADEGDGITGTLRIEGATPFTREILLTDDKGKVWDVEAPGHAGELYLLSGQRIRVQGASNSGKEEDPAVIVSSYEILPGEGMVAIRGRIVVDRDAASITDEAGNVKIIDGPLADVLAGFDGLVAWVWGRPGDGSGDRVDDVLSVEGYEILPGAR